MRCEEANAKLVEFANDQLSPEEHLEVEQLVAGCEKCQEDLAAIRAFQALSSHWDDETPPAWSPPRIQGQSWRDLFDSFRVWFPTLTSVTALVLVTVMFVQQPVPNGILPERSSPATNVASLPQLPQATEAAMVQRVLETSEEHRAQEIQALLKILKAEMDKRSIETEESLRYIISHQIQGQQELDELYQQVEELMNVGPTQETPGDQGGSL